MPSPFSGALGYANNQQILAEQMAYRRQMFEEQMQQRRLAQQQLNAYRQFLAQNATRRTDIYSQRFAYDKATVDYVLGLDPSRVEPAWRNTLVDMQKYLRQSPNPEIAKAWVSKYRPGGLQFKSFDTTDPNTLAVTTHIVAFDPYGGGLPAGLPAALGAGGGSPGPASAGGVGAPSPVPAPPASRPMRPARPAPPGTLEIKPAGGGPAAPMLSKEHEDFMRKFGYGAGATP